jgi:hypothetical protein
MNCGGKNAGSQNEGKQGEPVPIQAHGGNKNSFYLAILGVWHKLLWSY